jgi:hypothetical protein
MDSLKDTILNYRNKFRRLGRTYHILIGSQLFFALAAFRYHRHQNNLTEKANSSNKSAPIKTNLIITESGSELVSAPAQKQKQQQQQQK